MTEPPASAPTAEGRQAAMASTGSPQPMTPVEQGRISPGAIPRSPAASEQTRSDASTPPGAHTLETLLLITIAPSLGSPSLRRPTTTGAPGNAFLVNTAAKSGEGVSSAMRVSVIVAGFGASAGVKANLAVPTRKPAGSAACAASHARCDARSVNIICVLGIA